MNFSSVINGVWWTLAECLMNFGILCAHFGTVTQCSVEPTVPKCAHKIPIFLNCKRCLSKIELFFSYLFLEEIYVLGIAVSEQIFLCIFILLRWYSNRKFDKKVLGRWPIISASKIGGRYRLLKKIGIC